LHYRLEFLLRVIEAGARVQAPGIGNRYPQARRATDDPARPGSASQKSGCGTELQPTISRPLSAIGGKPDS